MAFKSTGKHSAPPSPQRAPAPSAERDADSPPWDTEDNDHEFPDHYECEGPPLGSPFHSAPPSAKTLDAGLERLIDLACGHLGCPQEEVAYLKAQALVEPEPIASFCQEIFDERIRPEREKPPLFPTPSPEGSCLFILEGSFGKTIFQAPMRDALLPYHQQSLELYDLKQSPFAALLGAKDDEPKAPTESGKTNLGTIEDAS